MTLRDCVYIAARYAERCGYAPDIMMRSDDGLEYQHLRATKDFSGVPMSFDVTISRAQLQSATEVDMTVSLHDRILALANPYAVGM